MVTDAWIEETVFSYALMSESARAEVWDQLSLDQQSALQEGLAQLELDAQRRESARPVDSTFRKGMIMGCLITLAVEAVVFGTCYQQLSH